MKALLKAVFLTIALLFLFATPFAIYAQDGTLPIPTDLTVWGGISLALILNRVVVPVLALLGVIKDSNKKLIGYILGAAGMLIGAGYSIFSTTLDDPLKIITNVAAGGLAGVLAVGLHSTFKNGNEYFKKLPQ